MMRYQRVSPDCLPLTNGKKPYLRPSPSRASSKEDAIADNGTASATSTGGGINGACTSTSSAFDGVSKGFRFRSQQDPRDPNHTSGPGPSPSRGGGDVLLQWGQRKRSRVSRAEIRSAAADDSSSSSGQGRTMSSNKLQRRSANPAMPPPPPLLSGVSSGRTTNPRNGLVSSKESSGLIPARNLEDRSAANGSPSRNVGGRAVSRSVAAAAAAGAKRSPPSPDKTEKKTNGKDYQNQRQNGFDPNHNHHHHQRGNRSESTAQVQLDHETNNNNGEKTGLVEVIEWPRIYIALSRKEKEDDFLVMKGTKLPHRPRKRAKNIDKALQYCFPGMWLSDLTKSRYEVREKKSVKKQQKRRGLKGMESLDTDSE